MAKSSITYGIISLLLLIISSCGTLHSPYYGDDALDWESRNQTTSNQLLHALYLVGDAGELDNTLQNSNYVLEAVSELLSEEQVETSLVYLGDNVYPFGLPNKESSYRKTAERILDAQLSLSEIHDGKTYMIPGNHDWNKLKMGGRKAILRQEDFVRSYGDKNIKFYPKNACGDPEVVKINKDLVFVFLDTQWWLQDWKGEKEMNHKCEIKSRGDLLKRVEEIFVDHKNDEIIVMMHHPIQSNGKHGGNYSLKHHIFPLTEINSKLWIPLPVIGSLYPIYKNVTGSKQDVTNIDNRNLMQGMDDIAKRLRINVIFASGHEHGLQYFDEDNIKYIVSGGGSRNNYTQSGGGAYYARDARGFAKINFYENNESWLEMYTVSIPGGRHTLEYRQQLRLPREGTVEEEESYAPITESTIVTPANAKFAAGSIKKLFLGEQYRDIWSTPVTAEVINLETKLGGLTPIKKGGGMASNSLRMERENGQQYILRSINKDYTKLVPDGFENLKIIDLIADQNSASHPYNALVIPTLSQASGVYYTDPKLMYLRHQRGLGNYNSQFPEELYLLEERPDDDWSDAAQFGNSSEIIGYTDLLDILANKKNHFVDQKWVLKSRMFDLFIHDWDRHDDQWRWAKFDEEGKNIYRPIPRDRDQAFYKFKGIIPWYISTFMIKQFKTMKGDVKDVKNLSFNAKHFDRYFLHDIEWSEWQSVISKMQKDITDADIENAMQQFPKEIMGLEDVAELEHLLKSRRDNLMQIGKRLYDFLSEEVEIIGTHDENDFVVEQMENGNINVKMYVERKNKDVLIKYDRTFYPSETKEIRLYGLRGKDVFKIIGDSNSKINLIIIGGEDDDEIYNETKNRKLSIYDNLDGIIIQGEHTDRRSSDFEVNEYDRYGFQYDTGVPSYRFGISVDDGLWIGGGYSWTSHGWRAEPYRAKQSLSFSIAPGGQNAVLIDYSGHFPDAFKNIDLVPEVDFNFPEYENYFGLGGNTTNPLREREFHWVRMRNIDINPLIRLDFGKSCQIDFGPTYRYRNIIFTDGRVTDVENIFFTEDALDARNYLGGLINFNLGYSDDKVFPTNGFGITASASHTLEMQRDEAVTDLSIESHAYIQLLSRPMLVLANNIGYQATYGNRQFYQYAALGNNSGLRGYRNERFRGDAMLYNNTDLRLKLLTWNNNILPMDVGVLGGYDIGKVYFDDTTVNTWKSSQTIGLWMEILGAAVLQPYYSFNEEQNTITVQLGFSF